MGPDPLIQAWADPRHAPQILHMMEASQLTAESHDALREHGADAGQGLELSGGGRREVDRLRWRALAATA